MAKDFNSLKIDQVLTLQELFLVKKRGERKSFSRIWASPGEKTSAQFNEDLTARSGFSSGCTGLSCSL